MTYYWFKCRLCDWMTGDATSWEFAKYGMGLHFTRSHSGVPDAAEPDGE